ncbi:hypothetical protein HZS_6432, partial [Henneguya salminicola]
DVITIDNSYTQVEYQLFSHRSKICKVMKQADITRKSLKKKASMTLSQDHDMHRYFFISGAIVDAVSFVPPNRGRNVSTCCVKSATRLENFEVIIGPFNKERFLKFLLKCFNERTFTGRPIVVLDNVRFHKCREVFIFFDSRDIEYMFLTTYTPQFNPIEEFFSALKSNYHRIRPKPQTTPDL